MRVGRRIAFFAVLIGVLALLHGVPLWRLVLSPSWPTAITAGTAILLVGVALLFPFVMVRGHGPRHEDRFALAGDIWLGVVFQLFTYTVLAEPVRVVLRLAGVPDPDRSRWLAAAVLTVVVGLLAWGATTALGAVPVREIEVHLPRLGRSLDGLRVVQLTDTHLSLLLDVAWVSRVVHTVNGLRPDIVAHTGDLADGAVRNRDAAVDVLGTVSAADARVFITGNHEYMSDAPYWVDRMSELGWTVLHNRHIEVRRGQDVLVVAGIDDRTARGSGLPGHGADLPAALAGAPADAPVLLLAHQPWQVRAAVAAGIDLQLSGHTHGGQIWPFHLIVRAEQGALHGLSQPGPRTQLYTSRGAGFWGPPFRIGAPPEITLVVLRSTQHPGTGDSAPLSEPGG